MKLREWVGRRGAALLFFALLDLVFAWALLDPPTPLAPTYAWVQQIAPLWVWGTCWATTGLICVFCAFLPRDAVAFTAAEAMKMLWGLLAGIGWLAGKVPYGYVSAAIWLAFAAFIYLIAGGIPPAKSTRE